MAPVRASRRLLCAFVVPLLAAGGCASEFEQRYAEAERLRQQAAAIGHEWIETATLLEQATEQAAAGDTAAALQLVDKARFQSKAALMQAERESEAWKSRVVR